MDIQCHYLSSNIKPKGLIKLHTPLSHIQGHGDGGVCEKLITPVKKPLKKKKTKKKKGKSKKKKSKNKKGKSKKKKKSKGKKKKSRRSQD